MDIQKEIIQINKISDEKEEKENFDKYCEQHEEELLEKILAEARSLHLLDE